MRRINWLFIGAVSLVLASGAWAQETDSAEGAEKTVRFEIALEDSSVTPAIPEKGAVMLGPGAVRMDSELDESGSPSSSMIYQRESKSYLVLFHDNEEAVVYDVGEFKRYAEKNEALQEKLWERLSMGRSPEESEALKKMRQSRRETARLGQQAMQAGLKLEKTEETGVLDGHSWVKFQELRSGTLAREFLVTPWEQFGIGEETSEIFEEIADFAEQRREISGGMNRAPDPFEYYDEFGGFPLVMRQFDGEGNVVLESRVTAIETVESSEALFQNPGYPEEGLADRVPVIE